MTTSLIPTSPSISCDRNISSPVTPRGMWMVYMTTAMNPNTAPPMMTDQPRLNTEVSVVDMRSVKSGIPVIFLLMTGI